MIVLHLEDNDITREALARLLGVKNGQLDILRYMATAVSTAARKRLMDGQVKLLILDFGLNASWDNEHMVRVLRHLALGEPIPDPRAPATCEAHGIALLAHQHQVPCALLTNYVDYFDRDPPLTVERLKEAFRAEAVFPKDEDGLEQCALWVRQRMNR